MGKMLNIEVSDENYQALSKLAKQYHTSISGVFEKFMEGILPKGETEDTDYKNDPLYKMDGTFNSGLGDISVNHDKYLYEQ